MSALTVGMDASAILFRWRPPSRASLDHATPLAAADTHFAARTALFPRADA